MTAAVSVAVVTGSTGHCWPIPVGRMPRGIPHLSLAAQTRSRPAPYRRLDLRYMVIARRDEDELLVEAYGHLFLLAFGPPCIEPGCKGRDVEARWVRRAA